MVNQDKTELEKYFPTLETSIGTSVPNTTRLLTRAGEEMELRKWALEFSLQNGFTGNEAIVFAEQVIAYVKDGKAPNISKDTQ